MVLGALKAEIKIIKDNNLVVDILIPLNIISIALQDNWENIQKKLNK